MLLAVAAAGWLFGRALLGTRWAAAALVLAMSIRHRVPKTGVNTLEHYFQPRMIAFALGTAGLAALVRGRAWRGARPGDGRGLVHPHHRPLVLHRHRRRSTRRSSASSAAAADPSRPGAALRQQACSTPERSPTGSSSWMPSGSRALRPRTTCSRTDGPLPPGCSMPCTDRHHHLVSCPPRGWGSPAAASTPWWPGSW